MQLLLVKYVIIVVEGVVFMLKNIKLKSKTSKKNLLEDFQKIHFKSIHKIQNIPEYKLNEMQIMCIKKILIEKADVPEKLISWLIDAVRNNTALEYTVTLKNISHG